MAQPAGRQAEELHVGAVYPRPRPRQDSASLYYGGSTSERVCLKALLCTAEASTTKEPDAEKLHVRDCTRGAGQPAFLPLRNRTKFRGQHPNHVKCVHIDF